MARRFNYMALRDDILKKIYPNARTDAQQEQYYLTKFDPTAVTGASDPFADVPINSLNDLYNYMKKAKEIIDRDNLTDATGRDKMIPGQINAAGGDGSSVLRDVVGQHRRVRLPVVSTRSCSW